MKWWPKWKIDEYIADYYLANLTPILGIENLSCTLTIAAHGLNLLDHSGSQLLDSASHTGSHASVANLNGSLFTASPFTFVANNIFL